MKQFLVRMSLHINALLALLLVLLMGCAGGGAGVSEGFVGAGMPDTTIVARDFQDRISTGDTVGVNVFGVKELSGEYVVEGDGQVLMPLIGRVPAAEMTTAEFSKSLYQRLNGRYLNDPDIIVFLEEGSARRLTIDGSIKKPGVYPLENRTTLLQAVALAGGPAEDANLKNVVVFRQIDGARQGASFNLNNIRKGEAPDPEVFGNDVIVVDGSIARRTYGDVLSAIRAATLLKIF